MTNAIKVLLQMPSGFLQLESTLLASTTIIYNNPVLNYVHEIHLVIL
jgi:hypothetical protein